jgi:hypothetical protein
MFEYLREGSLIASVGRYSGLGNRMRTVLSAQSLAEIEGRRYFYCWPTGAKFGTRLTELWTYDVSTVPRAATRVLAARYPYRDATLTWIDRVRSDRIWQIRTGQPLSLPPIATPWTDRLRDLRPTTEISDRVTDVFDRHLRGMAYVGVMIRVHQHSHELTRQMSPVDWFTNRMRQIRMASPDLGFYISCDVPEIQEQIVGSFDNAFGLTGKGGYNSPASLKASVVDLYLLASSVHILAPHYSSFPELALYLAGKRIALETSMIPSRFPVDAQLDQLAADPTRPDCRAASPTA